MSFNSVNAFTIRLLLATALLMSCPFFGFCQEITSLSNKDYGIMVDHDFIVLGDSLEKHTILLNSARQEIRFEEVYGKNQNVYSLSGIEIASYVDFGGTVDTMQILADGVKTYRGLAIGSTRAQVLAKYPKPAYENAKVMVYSFANHAQSGSTWNLNFFLANEVVYKICYNIAGP